MKTPESIAEAAVLLSEARIRLLAALQAGPKTVTALHGEVGGGLATVSQNLQILLRGGAVSVEPKGSSREYRLAADLHPLIAAALALLEE